MLEDIFSSVGIDVRRSNVLCDMVLFYGDGLFHIKMVMILQNKIHLFIPGECKINNACDVWPPFVSCQSVLPYVSEILGNSIN